MSIIPLMAYHIQKINCSDFSLLLSSRGNLTRQCKMHSNYYTDTNNIDKWFSSLPLLTWDVLFHACMSCLLSTMSHDRLFPTGWHTCRHEIWCSGVGGVTQTLQVLFFESMRLNFNSLFVEYLILLKLGISFHMFCLPSGPAANIYCDI